MFSKKTVQFIRSLKLKKYRHQHQSYIAEGDKWFNEIIQNDVLPDAIFLTDKQLIDQYQLTEKYIDKISIIKPKELEQISQLKTPNKVLCLLPFFSSKLNINTFKEDFTLVCDNIKDPGNLGTIIRTASWYNFKQIILSPECVDIYNSKVVQSTMGALLHVNIHQTELIELFKENVNVPIYPATLKGKNIKQAKLENGFVVIGSESHGVDKAILKLTSERITIPKYGKAESLNAAVAAGIICDALRN